MNDQGSSNTVNQNLMAALCYSLTIITGIVFFLKEPNNRFIRFHAIQSIAASVGMIVLDVGVSFLPGIISNAASTILGLVTLIGWLYVMYQAYQGIEYKLPLVGDFAEKEAAKVNS